MPLDFDMDAAPLADIIEAMIETFDFTLPTTGGGTLGEDLAAQAADDIAQRSSAGLDVDGKPFRPNSEVWAAYKLKEYEVDRPGELSGQMLSLNSCLGKPEFAPDKVVLRHGLDITPEDMGYVRSRGGKRMKPDEIDETDTDKGIWFTEGGREFYKVDAQGEQNLADRADATLEDHLAAFNGG